MVHHFTVDVEEHFQVSAMQPYVARAEWDGLPSRVEASTLRIVELLEAHGMHGTFFILGWVARRQPELVRRIASGGHEIASHGWDHKRVTELDPTQFRRQVRDSREFLQELTGTAVVGYRAPSFSIVPGREWALEILAEEGYRYDSSLYPVRRRGYGYPGGRRRPHAVGEGDRALLEFPPLTLRAFGTNLPAGGGGTFRHFPWTYTAGALRRAERESVPGTFYIHPWEVDPEQPRIPDLPLLTRIRHYRGIGRTMARLRRLVSAFEFRPIRETLGELAPTGSR